MEKSQSIYHGLDPLYKKSLIYSIVDVFFYSQMMALGEAFIIPLALFKGFSGAEIGLIASLPILCGAFIQFFNGIFISFFKTRKRTILIFVFIQVLSLLAFIYFVIIQSKSFILFIAISIVYWGINLAISPSWASWMADLTKDTPRERYFARRSQISNFSLLIGMIPAGFFLHYCSNSNIPDTGFIVLFSLAAFARVKSLVMLSLKYEPEIKKSNIGSPLEFIKEAPRVLKSRNAPLLYFIVLFNFGLFFASPFFIPFMLNEIKLGYEQFAVIQSIGVISKIIFLPAWGFLSEHYGTKKPLILSASLAAVMPLFWLLSANFLYIAAITIFTGFIWGGFELSSFNMMLDRYSGKDEVLTWSLYNTINGTTQVISSTFSGKLQTFGLLGYHDVFIVSSVLRILAIVFMAKRIFEHDSYPHIKYYQLFLRVLSARSSLRHIPFNGKNTD